MSSAIIEFPDFNLYSTPLLVLVTQGLFFAGLLFHKYLKKGVVAYGILSAILLITCYHRTTYTIGFMDWYDTYRNTKINYYLINLGLVVAPLIFFYVKSVTTAAFTFKRKDWLHFLPGLLYILIKLVVLVYDASQDGFADTQNGYLVIHFQWPYVDPVMTIASIGQMLLYLAFSFQLYYHYRNEIRQHFSNTYKLELAWLRNFLYCYSFLFLYDLIQIGVSEVGNVQLSWTQKWWQHFATALLIIYIGVKGYFTDTDKLSAVRFERLKNTRGEEHQHVTRLSSEQEEIKTMLMVFMHTEKPYLDPELNLVTLSQKLDLTRATLSEVINDGFDKNFNDFINAFRVNSVKEMIDKGKAKQMSLLGIALECGFNSKATFNRVFKKMTGTSPSLYGKK